MRCPYCGIEQTEVLRAIHRRHKTYRYRKCHFCKARFRTQEKAVRWEGVDRKWPGTRPERNGWKNHRVAALRGNCEVVTCGVAFSKSGPCRHVDHIVPARLIRKLRAGNPDRRENLECICGTCHGYKLQADHKLCMGDKLGYLEVRDPRITPESLEALGRSGRLSGLQLNRQEAEGISQTDAPQEGSARPEETSQNSGNGMQGTAKAGRASRAKRVWTEVAQTLGVSIETVQHLIVDRTLKVFDPRITERSLMNLCRRNGSLLNWEFLDAETRGWLQSSMDLDRRSGMDATMRLNPFRKHALVVRKCKRCGRAIRGNAFFAHSKCGKDSAKFVPESADGPD